MKDLHELTIKQVHEGLKSKKFSSQELTKHALKRIKEFDPKLNSYVVITENEALAKAKKLDEKGEYRSPLSGVPANIKDLICTKGVRSTCASLILKDFTPPYSATCVRKLEENDYVLTGKVNLDEFACGVSTEHSCHGVTKNPWDITRVSGGSSGGSAASVAAGFSYYSLGTDTGGSIRCPASFCGVTGLKVTYGRVSRSGVTSMASSWDTVGPIAKTVEDCAYVLNAIAGSDPKDSTTPNVPVQNYIENLNQNIKGLKIGLPKEYFSEGVDREVAGLVQEAAAEFEKQGAKLKEISLPTTKYAVAVYYITMPAELSANLARFDAIRYGSKPSEQVDDLLSHYLKSRNEGFGDEIKRRIMIGTYVLSAGYYDSYYKKAQQVRTLIIQDFEKAFEEVDAILAPSFPTVAFEIGGKVSDPLQMYLVDALTIPASAAGLPALNLPCGFFGGLPVGMQLIAPQFKEDLVLKAGHNYQKFTNWHTQIPIF